MAPRYARDQPEGFTNRIENVAIGAGGSIGKHIITALTRPGNTSKIPEGVHSVARIDYTNTSDDNDDSALVGPARAASPPHNHERASSANHN
ncbi:uncharacterized protein BDV17DRAFT_294603 [Aspergillus undulatus]|uniref:uncharacterized protein n=1 Tax=Aspergillus undulatus TaxID=1810928 RepID=UPI003CCDB585